MSFAEEILIILSSYSGGYKMMRRKIYGLPDGPENPSHFKEEYLRVVLSRLKKRGLVANKNHAWNITKKGKEHLKNNKKLRLNHFGSLKVDEKSQNETMVVAFDIPEKKKFYRNWLRSELISLNFEPIQKSVWLGPYPLPKKFIEYLNEINILSHLKFFKVRKENIVSG